MSPMPRIALIVTITLLSACGEQSAAVRVCMAASGAEPSSPIAARCRCVDDLARRQLGPDGYQTVEAAARAAEREGATATGLAASADVLGRELQRADPAERIIAVGDAALIVAKAAARCG